MTFCRWMHATRGKPKILDEFEKNNKLKKIGKCQRINKDKVCKNKGHLKYTDFNDPKLKKVFCSWSCFTGFMKTWSSQTAYVNRGKSNQSEGQQSGQLNNQTEEQSPTKKKKRKRASQRGNGSSNN